LKWIGSDLTRLQKEKHEGATHTCHTNIKKLESSSSSSSSSSMETPSPKHLMLKRAFFFLPPLVIPPSFRITLHGSHGLQPSWSLHPKERTCKEHKQVSDFRSSHKKGIGIG